MRIFFVIIVSVLTLKISMAQELLAASSSMDTPGFDLGEPIINRSYVERGKARLNNQDNYKKSCRDDIKSAHQRIKALQAQLEKSIASLRQGPSSFFSAENQEEGTSYAQLYSSTDQLFKKLILGLNDATIYCELGLNYFRNSSWLLFKVTQLQPLQASIQSITEMLPTAREQFEACTRPRQSVSATTTLSNIPTPATLQMDFDEIGPAPSPYFFMRRANAPLLAQEEERWQQAPVESDQSEELEPATETELKERKAKLASYRTPLSEREDPENCSICITDFCENTECICELPCKHTFHTDCMLGWAGNKIGNSCPECRESYMLTEASAP